jgi:hypothetical protein
MTTESPASDLSAVKERQQKKMGVTGDHVGGGGIARQTNAKV